MDNFLLQYKQGENLSWSLERNILVVLNMISMNASGAKYEFE